MRMLTFSLPTIRRNRERRTCFFNNEKIELNFSVMAKFHLSRRKFINTIATSSCIAQISKTVPLGRARIPKQAQWQAGIGRRVITPNTPVWLAGYGTKRVPEGKIHDIWVKVLALRSAAGDRMIIATTDHMGMSKTIYDRLYKKVKDQFQVERSGFILTYSHNHCAPCLEDDLVDYYPSDEAQKQLVKEYTHWMESQVLEAIHDALANLKPAQLSMGEGHCTFAVNRRDNVEADVPALLQQRKPLKGVVDHYVPVLAIKGENEKLIGMLFGYACHPTTLNINKWNGDYPGYAQINLEARFPGTTAMFFNTCGADQNPIPRREIKLCEKYGKMLSDAVEKVLDQPMEPVSSKLDSAFKFIDLKYEEVVTREKLIPIANGDSPLHARWAKRMLKKMDDGDDFPDSYPYPVQAWQLGNLLLIGIGGEAVVDYSLRFKKDFPGMTWVCGYSNYMTAYIPSRRIWEEGGYEGGSHLDEYGHPAWRWKGDIEERIAQGVYKVVHEVQKK